MLVAGVFCSLCQYNFWDWSPAIRGMWTPGYHHSITHSQVALGYFWSQYANEDTLKANALSQVLEGENWLFEGEFEITWIVFLPQVNLPITNFMPIKIMKKYLNNWVTGHSIWQQYLLIICWYNKRWVRDT